MKIKIQVVIELDSGNTQIIQEVSKIERNSLQPENLGLSIAESKTLLQNIQATLVKRQVAEYLAQNSSCLHCEKKLLHKDKRTIVYRHSVWQIKSSQPATISLCLPRTTNPLLQPNCYLTNTTHFPRTIVFRVQVCGVDVLWIICQTTARSVAN